MLLEQNPGDGHYYGNAFFCYLLALFAWPICGSGILFPLLLSLNRKLNVKFNLH